MSHGSHPVVRDVERILVRRAASHRELEGSLEFFIVFLQTVVGVVKHQLHEGGIHIVGLSKAEAVTTPGKMMDCNFIKSEKTKYLLINQAVPDLIAALDREGVFLVLGGPADEKGSVFLALQQLHGPVPVNVRHQPGLLLTVGHLPAGLDQQPGHEQQ